MINSLVLLFAAAGAYGTALIFGTIGEILTEKSGNLNLGVEGIMYMGGIFGLIAPNMYETAVGEGNANPFVAILLAIFTAFFVGALAGALFSFITVTLRANQNVTGLAMTTFGTGVAKFAGELRRIKVGGYVTLSNELKFAFDKHIMPDFLKKIPIIGKILFDQSEFFYLAIICAVVMYLFLSKTKTGLYLRSVGESPVTADAAGINITKYKYLATIIGGGISAIGGMVYTMTTAGCVWIEASLAGTGWLAVALVIFCTWRPLHATWSSLLFGGLMIMYLRIIIKGFPTELYKILPYLVTIIVLIITSMRNIRDKQPPASLGNNYFREER
ncbi:MAG: ABC transporter permease [Sphaerochaetaceae bacterium]|nr:ABC transporter permease [Sphaerochaetaceae bacterium]